jgi:hypothetical protein
MSIGDRRVIVYGRNTSEFGASLRAAFPECAVDVVDHPGPPTFDDRPVLADVDKGAEWLSPECIYVVLGWLGGTVAEPIVQAGVGAVISATRKWWRNRSGDNAVEDNSSPPLIVILIGQDGTPVRSVRADELENGPPAEALRHRPLPEKGSSADWPSRHPGF